MKFNCCLLYFLFVSEVLWSDGFALARSSNTTPVVVLRLEGDTPEALERIKKTFAQVLLKVDPSLELPF